MYDKLFLYSTFKSEKLKKIGKGMSSGEFFFKISGFK
jgi:hypothetical protein